MRELAYLDAALIVGAVLIISIAAKPIGGVKPVVDDEQWTQEPKTRCAGKQGYLAYARRSGEPTEEVICLSVIFREKAP